jgi:hypothetical protein
VLGAIESARHGPRRIEGTWSRRQGGASALQPCLKVRVVAIAVKDTFARVESSLYVKSSRESRYENQILL